MSKATVGDATLLLVGSEVACSDGACGKLARIVVDPVASTVTHLAVEPPSGWSSGRLVPIELVDAAGKEIRLQCTLGEFEALDQSDEMALTPGTSGLWSFGPGFGFGMGGGIGSMGLAGMGAGPQAVVTDAVPAGEVEVQRGDHVHAIDGEIGRVQGLMVDADGHRVTHVLLADGHLWGQRRVLIPITAITGVEDGVQLNLTKSQVHDLPEADAQISG